MNLTNAHDGIPPAAYLAAGLLAVVLAGHFITAVIRAARVAVDCCPHPDLDDFPEETTSRG